MGFLYNSTIILVPKLQPVVSDYIESEFINNVGLGIAIFVINIIFNDISRKSIK